MREVEDIIANHGWVGKSLVGEKANSTLTWVMHHNDLKTREKYLPLLKQSVINGESSGADLAILQDRINTEKGKPQIYGSQLSRDAKTGKYTLYEIFEPEYLNQRRKSVGLGPIEEYLKRWDITWDVQQLEK